MDNAQQNLDASTTNPERIRALAHPLRLVLLDLLDERGEATATECAELTGESVASCSFHLRMLAKYGYVEAGQRRGRDKPWRATSAMHGSFRPDLEDSASIRAVEALAAVVVDQESQRIRQWLATLKREAQDWAAAVTVTKTSFWATADELAELSRQVQALTDRFARRRTDPSARPPGSRPARLFAVVNPDPLPATVSGIEADHGHDQS
jgi:DNA-binding transcriptional ArsR family regulator